jgi:hypothetical protein
MGALQQESGMDYLHRVQSIIRRLESLGSPVGDEGFQAATIIRGLPMVYQPIKQAFYARSSAVWTINDIKCSVKDTDQQQVRDNNPNGNNSLGGAFLASDHGLCHRCHQLGHVEQNCRAILPRGNFRSSPAPDQSRQQRPPRREYSLEERTAYLQRKLAEALAEAKEQAGKKVVTFLANDIVPYADDTSDADEPAAAIDEDEPISLDNIYCDGGDNVFMTIATPPRPVTTVPPLELLRTNPEQRCSHAVIDSGASKHISAVRADFGSTLRPINDPYHIGGVCVKAVGIGSVSWQVVDKTGQAHIIRLSNVLYAPELLERTTYHTRLISTRMAGREGYRFDLGDVNNGMFTKDGQSRTPTRLYLPIVGGVPVLLVKFLSSISDVPPTRPVKPGADVFIASTFSAAIPVPPQLQQPVNTTEQQQGKRGTMQSAAGAIPHISSSPPAAATAAATAAGAAVATAATTTVTTAAAAAAAAITAAAAVAAVAVAAAAETAVAAATTIAPAEAAAAAAATVTTVVPRLVVCDAAESSQITADTHATTAAYRA